MSVTKMYRLFRKEDLTAPPRPEVDLLFGTGGVMSGMMYCDAMEYGVCSTHDDQEGFLVLEGHGKFRIGDEEISVCPDMAILIPPHVLHGFKKDSDSPDMKIFYFHAANT